MIKLLTMLRRSKIAGAFAGRDQIEHGDYAITLR
jgi:hypothetical protein